jgi:hypothetical protein
MNADLQLGNVKSTFNKDAKAATTKAEVSSAYTRAESAAIQLLGAIDTKMQDEILSVAPGYDLGPA